MFASKTNSTIAVSLLFTVVLWGANTTAIKFLLRDWPPIWIGSSRMLCVGALMLAVLRWTDWLGPRARFALEWNNRRWWQTGLGLAVYVAVFTWSLQFTPASHVALYLGTSPVWAVLWEGRPRRDWDSARRYGAAALTVAGVAVLFWPKLKLAANDWLGDGLALVASVLWTHYSRQCRALSAKYSGVEITAHTMWRAALCLAPVALVEAALHGLPWRVELVLAQGYCVLGGGVLAFAFWHNALRHWPTSRVFLMGNLVPLTTMLWAHACLKEPITPTFWPAMLLIVGGVLLGQANWQKLFGLRWLPAE